MMNAKTVICVVIGAVLLLGGSGTAYAQSERQRAGTGLPPASQVPLDLRPNAAPDVRVKSEKLYDYVRQRLIAERIDHQIAIDVLASMTKHGRMDFTNGESLYYPRWQTRRPSALNLLCWRQSLLAIAADTDRIFNAPPLGYRPAAEDEEFIPDLRGPDNGLSARAPSAMRRVLTPLEDPKVRCPKERAPLSGSFKWRRTVRIAPTGNPNIDNAIARALRRIKTEVPRAPIDASSFPAAPEAANLFFGKPLSGSSAFYLDFVLPACFANPRCTSVQQIMGFVTPDTRSSEAAGSALLASAYLTRPLGLNFHRPMAFVQLSGKTISAAICGFEDKDEDADTLMFIQSCLAQALGAYPTEDGDAVGYDPAHEAKLIEIEMVQLARLYR